MFYNIFNIILLVFTTVVLYTGIHRLIVVYYLNGKRHEQTITYNKHLFFEFLQILFWLVIILFQFYYIGINGYWYALIAPIIFTAKLLSRIETIILCKNCEICLEKNVIVFKNRYGIISTIKSPFKITIDIIDGNRPTLFSLSDSKSKDHQLHIVNEENNEITINLSENNLADYRFQIQQDVLDIYGKEALKSEFESIDQKISNRNLLFLVLGLSIVWFVFLALKKLI